MNSLRYLNGVLTVIAILLVIQISTAGQQAEALSISSPAMASPASYGAAFPNASSQRKQMVTELSGLNKQVEKLASLFRSGQAKVQVSKK